MAAHAAQGQTFNKGVIVDLNVGVRSSTMASYVALTRVQTRDDLLIHGSFPFELFSRGVKAGMDLLLQVLRGEDVDWDAVEKQIMPCKTRSLCACYRKVDGFNHT